MDDTYYLASLKLQGWFSRTSQFTSVFADAKPFDRDEALEMCRRYKGVAHVLIPVRAQDMEAI